MFSEEYLKRKKGALIYDMLELLKKIETSGELLSEQWEQYQNLCFEYHSVSGQLPSAQFKCFPSLAYRYYGKTAKPLFQVPPMLTVATVYLDKE